MKTKNYFSISSFFTFLLLVVVIMLVPAWSSRVSAQTSEAYAVLDAKGTLTFKYDAAKPKDAYGMDYHYLANNRFLHGIIRDSRLRKSCLKRVSLRHVR